MTTQDTKAIVQRISEEVYGNFDTSLIDQYFAEDFVNHTPMQGLSADREGVRQFIQAVRQGTSDGESGVKHLIVEGDFVSVHWSFRGRHTGEFMGIPATGRQIEHVGMSLYRFKDGKIVEEWSYGDDLGLMQQLGVLPQQEVA